MGFQGLGEWSKIIVFTKKAQTQNEKFHNKFFLNEIEIYGKNRTKQFMFLSSPSTGISRKLKTSVQNVWNI